MQDIFESIVSIKLAFELELGIFQSFKVDINPSPAHGWFRRQFTHVFGTCNGFFCRIVCRMKHLLDILMKLQECLGVNVFGCQTSLFQGRNAQIQSGRIRKFQGQYVQVGLAIIHGQQQVFRTRCIRQGLLVSSRRLVNSSKLWVTGIRLECLECFVKCIECLGTRFESIRRSQDLFFLGLVGKLGGYLNVGMTGKRNGRRIGSAGVSRSWCVGSTQGCLSSIRGGGCFGFRFGSRLCGRP
mmetsp:Transcript_27275/g.66198  ORF Transcript_27275/g.66198 Transcript_27275/m.66198 type:complete len:241 (-) Transcript_27275:412-1134(-)